MGLVALWHVGSSRTRDRTCVPCIGRQILNHWTTREVPFSEHFKVTTCRCFSKLILRVTSDEFPNSADSLSLLNDFNSSIKHPWRAPRLSAHRLQGLQVVLLFPLCPPRIHVYLEPMKETLCGNRVFGGVIKLNGVVLDKGGP